MSELKSPTPALYFSSIIFNLEKFNFCLFEAIWLSRFGQSSHLYPEFNPSLVYYAKEMGDKEKLKRIILCQNKPTSREDFISHKLWAQDLEAQHSVDSKRSINIDIGLLSLENMILATGKPFSHRVYLGHGVYADLNYTYQSGHYRTLPWTYPDYSHEEKMKFFKDMRSKLL